MYNEMVGNFDDIAINTFKSSLPAEHRLRKSLTGKLATSVCQLMDRIDKYKRVEEDQMQGRGKEKVIPQEMRDFRSDRYTNNRPRRDFVGQPETTSARNVGTIFREPVHQVLEKIKNEPYFRWPNKMAGESTKRNQNLYCQYHQDHGHTTKNCRNLWNYLDQLVREGKLRHLLHHSSGHQNQAPQEPRRDAALRPPVGTINTILATPGKTRGYPSQVLSVAQLPAEEDKVGTTQPHDDALLVILRIGGYDVKRVMVDGGSAAEIMYPDLFKGLKLKPEELMPYNSPLMSFDGKLVTPKGMIRLPIQTGPEIVEVNFIVVDTYSPYTAIVGRPWLHTLGAVASSLHQKVKFPLGDRVLDIRGCQPTARQCIVAAISHRSEMESSAPEEKDL